MTQAFNLSQLANNLNSSGQLDATDGLVNAVPVVNGGTGQNTLAAAAAAFGSYLFPVGSIYTNATNSTNPATLLGFGTWSSFGATRVLIGQDGSGYVAGAIGGSADAAVVSHSHTFSGISGSTDLSGTFYAANRSGPDPTGSFSYTGNTANSSLSGGGLTGDIRQYSHSANHTHSLSGSTSATGSSGVNANLQPYIVVYMWRRTA